jgi:hypothetical protein
VSGRPDHLPLTQTTPVTEAVENNVDVATRSLRDISYQLQSAISIASHAKAGADDAFIVQASRLGRALVFGYAAALSSAFDGIALIADDEVEWWWSAQLTLPFAKKDRRGVVRATVTTVPFGVTLPTRLVRVARGIGKGNVDLIDRGAGVPPNWNGTCYVSVRQYGDYKPGAALISFQMVGASGQTIVETKDPIIASFSM